MPKRTPALAHVTKGDTTLQVAADLPALTVAQAAAVDALVGGNGGADAAAAAGVNRVTISRWKNHHPVLIAALNDRRARVWATGTDRLRALAGKALDALGAVLDDADPHVRHRAAVTVIELGVRVAEVVDLEERLAGVEAVVRQATGAADGA